MSYYRIHSAARVEMLLDERTWKSRAWVGEFYRRCEECVGLGYVLDGERREVHCEPCSGRGKIEDVRRGVSCMESLDDLREYMIERHANMIGDVIMEIDGDLSDDEDHDADAGAVLVLPTRIISVMPVPADWIES